jgi:hypothetical protein
MGGIDIKYVDLFEGDHGDEKGIFVFQGYV